MVGNHSNSALLRRYSAEIPPIVGNAVSSALHPAPTNHPAADSQSKSWAARRHVARSTRTISALDWVHCRVNGIRRYHPG